MLSLGKCSQWCQDNPIMLENILELVAQGEKLRMEQVITLGNRISQSRPLQEFLGDSALEIGGKLVLSIMKEIIAGTGISREGLRMKAL